MEGVHLDAAQRRFIWPDGTRLDLDQSVAHIQKRYPDFRRDSIEECLIDWIDMDYAPEHYSEAQLDELDKLTARWIADRGPLPLLGVITVMTVFMYGIVFWGPTNGEIGRAHV